MSVVLLAGAGLFGRSFYNLVSQDFGMRTGDVLLVEFDRGPESGGGHAQLYADALERIRRLPGVEMATTVRTMPFTGFHVPPISVPGRAGPPGVNGQLPFLIAATPEFLEILGVTVVEGRRFVDADERGAPVVIVNETMARSVWPGGSALGKCIRIGFEPSFDPFAATGPPPPPTTVPCREVIGREMAIRLALGARPRAVLVMIQQPPASRWPAHCADASRPSSARRWVESMLFGTAPADSLVLGSAALLMLAVSALATFVPARWASRTDPCSILRAE